MKKFLTLGLFSLLTSFAMAQLPAGSTAPNFTATDINGNSWTLYDILGQGKTVIMDVSATWCGPCWAYHNSGALENLYETYGPNGTDEVMVLYIEGDGATTLADLNGTGGNTQGNWVAGTPYPIIDNAGIANSYEITYFPTIYKICPDRKVTEVGQLSTAQLYSEVGLCPVAEGNNNGYISSYLGTTGSFCFDINPSIEIMNLGTSPMTSATVQLSVNGSVVQTESWSGNLATYQSNVVEFDAISSDVDVDLSFNITQVNGGTDDVPANNTYTTSLSRAAEISQPGLTLQIMTDPYGEEVYWGFRGDGGAVVASGGNPDAVPGAGTQWQVNPTAGYPDNTLSTETITVPGAGCFEFYIIDDYGDGLCCAYGNGFWKLLDGTTVLAQGGEGYAEDGGNVLSELGVGTADLTNVNQLEVFPNPVADQLNIRFNLSESAPLTLTVTNTVGQVVRTVTPANYNAGEHLIGVNTSDLTSGLYLVTLRNSQGSLTVKFTK